MLAIAMAFVSALSWGTADFIGGLQSRRFAVPMVLLGASAGGLAFATAGVLLSGEGAPPLGDIGLGALAGLIGVGALFAFYHALAIGTMSIVAPISATGTAIPVVVGIASGDRLTAVIACGFVLVIAGVMLASREQDASASGVEPEDHRLSVLLAIVAALGFGTIFVLIANASEVSIFWPAAALKCTSLLVVGAGLLIFGRRVRTPWPAPRGWLPVLIVGCFDVGANATFAYASTHGPLSISAVVASMFPVVTVLLAYRLLGERLARSQLTGVAMALAGLAILSLAQAA